MKAIRVHEFGNTDVLRYEDIPAPEPGTGEVRVKIEAAGVNFIDIYHRTGLYPLELPAVPGMEGSGVVESVGPDVTSLKTGDQVAFAMQLGAYAEFVVVPDWKLVQVPAGIRMQDAAAVLLQGMTAHYLSHSSYVLQKGDTALIHAAAGGVGLLLVQMAKRCGARVIGTVSTEEKAELAKHAGADDIILYTRTDFEKEVSRLTGGEGVHVVYDSVGQKTFDKSLNCLKPRGYLILYGQSSGPVEPLDPQMLNTKGSLFLTRPTLGHYASGREELMRRAKDLFDWMKSGDLKVRIDKTFPLEDTAEAHRYMEGRNTKGKLLLIP